MKSFFLLTLSIFCISLPSFAQPVKAQAEVFRLTEGTKLIYHVQDSGKEYDFIATIKTLTPTVVFDYEITMPEAKQGTVTLKPSALKSATNLFTRFSGGPSTLEKETSVFVSQAIYNNAMKKPAVTISINGTPEKFNKLEGMDSKASGNMYAKMIRQVGSKSVSVDGPIFENAAGNHVIRFQETDYFPIITYLKSTFRMYLTDISQ